MGNFESINAITIRFVYFTLKAYFITYLRILASRCCWYNSFASLSSSGTTSPVTACVPKGLRKSRMWCSGLWQV